MFSNERNPKRYVTSLNSQVTSSEKQQKQNKTKQGRMHGSFISRSCGGFITKSNANILDVFLINGNVVTLGNVSVCSVLLLANLRGFQSSRFYIGIYGEWLLPHWLALSRCHMTGVSVSTSTCIKSIVGFVG
jgi:hypothetical protein